MSIRLISVIRFLFRCVDLLDTRLFWNRTSDQIVFTAIAHEAEKSRQMFVMDILAT